MSEDTIPLHYTVGVIEFASVDPEDPGASGFEWRTTPENLETALRRLIRSAPAESDMEFIIGLVDVPADMVPNGDFADLRPSEGHAITEFIEGEIHFGRVQNRQRFVVLANPSWPGAEMRRVLHLAYGGEEGSCPRHGGEWGDDVTCPKCTDEDGNPRARGGLACESKPIGSDTLDAICAVIDRVKTDERQLDTNEYAGMIENIIRGES